MANKAAHKRVCIVLIVLGDVTYDPYLAFERICCHAEGATAIRVGSPRREEHSDLCVPMSIVAYCIMLIIPAGNFLIVRDVSYQFYSHLLISHR